MIRATYGTSKSIALTRWHIVDGFGTVVATHEIRVITLHSGIERLRMLDHV